jgi:hypothetical protein
MHNSINIPHFLQLVAKITQYGEKTPEGYRYENFTVYDEMDGYQVTITNGFVTLTIFFHQKYDIDYPDERSLEQFQKQAEALIKKLSEEQKTSKNKT